MDLERFLSGNRKLVESHLRTLFSTLPGFSKTLKDAMEYSLFSEGKRIRPSLAIAACEAMEGRVDEVLPFAAASR